VYLLRRLPFDVLKPSLLGRSCPQLVKVEQQTQQGVVATSHNDYTYEDHLADMGNASSSSGGDVETMPIETEANNIGRMQAITGAKAVETRVKPRGPKADPADYGNVQASRSVVDP